MIIMSGRTALTLLYKNYQYFQASTVAQPIASSISVVFAKLIKLSTDICCNISLFASTNKPAPLPPSVVLKVSKPLSSNFLSRREYFSGSMLSCRRVIAQPPPPAPVSLVSPIFNSSQYNLILSKLGCDTPRETSNPWFILINSINLDFASASKNGRNIRLYASLAIASRDSKIQPVVLGKSLTILATLETRSAVLLGVLVLVNNKFIGGKFLMAVRTLGIAFDIL